MLKLLTIKNCPLFICSECRHVAVNDERHREHLREPRHVHHYRWEKYLSVTIVRFTSDQIHGLQRPQEEANVVEIVAQRNRESGTGISRTIQY